MTNRKVIGFASGAAIVVSIAIGSNMLTPKAPDVDTVQIPTQEVIMQTQEPSPSPSPSFAPSPSPTTTPTATPTTTPIAIQEVILEENKPMTTLEMFGISGKIIVEGAYLIHKIDGNKSDLSITVPDELSADIYELYLNGQYVDKQIIQQGKIIAPPIIFTMPDLLEVRIFKLQEVIAIGRFENDKLIISVKDGVLGV